MSDDRLNLPPRPSSRRRRARSPGSAAALSPGYAPLRNANLPPRLHSSLSRSVRSLPSVGSLSSLPSDGQLRGLNASSSLPFLELPSLGSVSSLGSGAKGASFTRSGSGLLPSPLTSPTSHLRLPLGTTPFTPVLPPTQPDGETAGDGAEGSPPKRTLQHTQSRFRFFDVSVADSRTPVAQLSPANHSAMPAPFTPKRANQQVSLARLPPHVQLQHSNSARSLTGKRTSSKRQLSPSKSFAETSAARPGSGRVRVTPLKASASTPHLGTRRQQQQQQQQLPDWHPESPSRVRSQPSQASPRQHADDDGQPLGSGRDSHDPASGEQASTRDTSATTSPHGEGGGGGGAGGGEGSLPANDTPTTAAHARAGEQPPRRRVSSATTARRSSIPSRRPSSSTASVDSDAGVLHEAPWRAMPNDILTETLMHLVASTSKPKPVLPPPDTRTHRTAVVAGATSSGRVAGGSGEVTSVGELPTLLGSGGFEGSTRLSTVRGSISDASLGQDPVLSTLLEPSADSGGGIALRGAVGSASLGNAPSVVPSLGRGSPPLGKHGINGAFAVSAVSDDSHAGGVDGAGSDKPGVGPKPRFDRVALAGQSISGLPSITEADMIEGDLGSDASVVTADGAPLVVPMRAVSPASSMLRGPSFWDAQGPADGDGGDLLAPGSQVSSPRVVSATPPAAADATSTKAVRQRRSARKRRRRKRGTRTARKPRRRKSSAADRVDGDSDGGGAGSGTATEAETPATGDGEVMYVGVLMWLPPTRVLTSVGRPG